MTMQPAARLRSPRRATSLGWGLIALALVSALSATGLEPRPAQAQGPDPSGGLESRLPASVAGHPVRLDPGSDLGAWIDEAYPGETPAELEALDAALTAQGAMRGDVRLAWAVAGEDAEVLITGFQLPGGDAQRLRDPILGVYFVGMGPLTRTEQEVAGHPVTIVSQGPPGSDAYPFGVVTDGDIVWIASAPAAMLPAALEALVGAANGTVPRYDPAQASTGPAYTAPWGWDGTVSQTITWDQGSYRGTAMGRHTGSWLQPPTLTGYCERDCTVYVPTGTIDWTWDVSAPTTPRCSASTRGTQRPGGTVTPQDQMLYLDPTGEGHVRFWGSGTFQVAPQPCVGWEAARAPVSFFSIPPPEDDDPFADEMADAFPSCHGRQWRIQASDTRIAGRCWNYFQPGYEDVVEWDLVAVEQ